MTKQHNEIDALGLKCPLPVLRLQKELQRINVGDCLILKADDPASVLDVPHFCMQSGHNLLQQEKRENSYYFTVQKSKSDSTKS